nr:PH-interacting protein [Ipomoea batatas]
MRAKDAKYQKIKRTQGCCILWYDFKSVGFYCFVPCTIQQWHHLYGKFYSIKNYGFDILMLDLIKLPEFLCTSIFSLYCEAIFDRSGRYVITGSDDLSGQDLSMETAFCLASCRWTLKVVALARWLPISVLLDTQEVRHLHVQSPAKLSFIQLLSSSDDGTCRFLGCKGMIGVSRSTNISSSNNSLGAPSDIMLCITMLVELYLSTGSSDRHAGVKAGRWEIQGQAYHLKVPPPLSSMPPPTTSLRGGHGKEIASKLLVGVNMIYACGDRIVHDSMSWCLWILFSVAVCLDMLLLMTYVLDVHPFNPRIAMSAGYDGKTILWDAKAKSQKDAKYDQETQLAPYRRNMQDPLCDSSMLPYPEPYQSMYQRRRFGALGIEWRPPSIKCAVGTDVGLGKNTKCCLGRFGREYNVNEDFSSEEKGHLSDSSCNDPDCSEDEKIRQSQNRRSKGKNLFQK